MIVIKADKLMMKEGADEIKIFSDLVAFLTELKRCGYKKVWINTASPYSNILTGMGHVIAFPPRKIDGWPAIWRSEKIEALDFKSSCGNGLDKADQRQFAAIQHLPAGEYDLTKKIHELVTKL